MEFVDCDNGVVYLHGLHTDMKPYNVHRMVVRGFITPASENMVRPLLKQMVIYLYNHQQTSPIFADKVSALTPNLTTSKQCYNAMQMNNGKNTLAYFLCAAHQQPREESQEHNQPKLHTTKQLPLEHWVSLYYALVAEIRILYADLQYRYGNDFGAGRDVLHHFGETGTSNRNEPFTALRLAAELENFWKQLMESRLVAALDGAAREKSFAQDAINFNRPEGLMDVNAMTNDQITDVLWSEYAPEVERRARENDDDAAARAVARESFYPDESRPNPHCLCDADCECRIDCAFQTDECACATARAQVQELVDDNLKLSRGVRHGLGPSVAVSEQALAAMADDVSQMRVGVEAAVYPSGGPGAYGAGEDVAAREDTRSLHSRRHRANTGDSGLACVPESRGAARGMSRGLFGEFSDHRYPSMRAMRHDNPPPMPERPSHAAGSALARRPVPAQSAPFSFAGPSSPPPQLPPVSQNETAFARSTPGRRAQHVRQDNMAGLTEAYTSLADEARDTIRPYSEEVARPESPLLPVIPDRPRRLAPPTSPLPLPPSSPAPIQAGKTRKTSGQADTLPLPDFIAPRPALKQRYVSAGGTAKLEDRPEIAGPDIVHTTTGASIDREELYERLADPEFIRQNFGEEAVGLTFAPGTSSSPNTVTTTTDAGERSSGAVTTGAGGRSSGAATYISGHSSGLRESVEGSGGRNDKRGRSESGVSGISGRLNRLKRVFSRKSGEGEGEKEGE